MLIKIAPNIGFAKNKITSKPAYYTDVNLKDAFATCFTQGNNQNFLQGNSFHKMIIFQHSGSNFRIKR